MSGVERSTPKKNISREEVRRLAREVLRRIEELQRKLR